MGYLIAILVCAGLFGAYFAFVGYEVRSGRRVLSPVRERFDARVSRAVFIIRHVDWSAFIGESVRVGSQKLVHAVAEGSLSAVRTIERLLTRLVRMLREHRAPAMRRPVGITESLKSMRNRFMKTKRAEVAPAPDPVPSVVLEEIAPEDSSVEEEVQEKFVSEKPQGPRPSSIG